MGHYLILITFCHAFLSCAIKTKFNNDELKWLNVYNEGDTIVFKSEFGEFDTSIIVKKEIYYPEYNPVEVHGKYLPQWAVVWYKNKNLEYHPDGHALINMIKKHPKHETSLTIDYLYSSILILNLSTDSIEKYRTGKIYRFETYHQKARSDQPKEIYWDTEFGVVKYIDHDGTVWIRINF